MTAAAVAVIPLAARALYNVLAACQAGVRLAVMPAEDVDAIMVVGVETFLPAESITDRTLYGALTELSVSVAPADKNDSGGFA